MRIKLLFCILLFIPLSNMLAQDKPNLYMFIVIQEDAVEVGALDNGLNMELLANQIGYHVPAINVVVKKMSGEEATKEKIERELSYLPKDSNNVIWYYYSGFGLNCDGYPYTDEQEVPLTWVHTQLKKTGAGITLAMYDCVTYKDLSTQPPSDLMPKGAFWKPLLLIMKGNYIASACSSTEYAAGNRERGGIFTNRFLDGLKTKSTWEEIFSQAKLYTTQESSSQHPVWASENVRQTKIVICCNPCSYLTREGDTWENILRSASRVSRNQTDITIGELKNLNPQYKDSATLPAKAKLKICRQ